MTVNEAVNMVDLLKPNNFDREVKVGWLSDLDGMIVHELYETHEDSPMTEDFEPYDFDRGGDRELLVGAPYDVLYRWYLESQIDLSNAETVKYNNSRAMFTSAYTTYADRYNRTHLPVQTGFKFTSGR